MSEAVIMRESWQPNDGDTKCQRCFASNPAWFCSHDLWNQVMGDEGGILCPTCFMNQAQAAGVSLLWEVLRR